MNCSQHPLTPVGTASILGISHKSDWYYMAIRFLLNITVLSDPSWAVQAGVDLHFPDSLQQGLWIRHIVCLLTSSPRLIEGQLDSLAHSVLCSLWWRMRDLHALTSISVVAAPKGEQSLCSAAGQGNTNSEVLWLYQTSWLCVCELCSLQRSSAPHLNTSFNCKLLGL